MIQTIFDTRRDSMLTVIRIVLGVVFFVPGARNMLG
jgi:hypothetical protein